MDSFFDVGRKILEMLDSVGEWLMSAPLAGLTKTYPALADIAPEAIEVLVETPLYALILGGGITIFLVWKLISFIIDILP